MNTSQTYTNSPRNLPTLLITEISLGKYCHQQLNMKLYLHAPVMENQSVAIIHGDTQIQGMLSNKCSIYTAEA